MRRIIEVAPGRFRLEPVGLPPARSDLPRPYLITDEMPPTEQVDGVHYTSKAKFRAAGRSLGLVEVGNEKQKPKTRASAAPEARQRRRDALKVAAEKYRAGYRART